MIVKAEPCPCGCPKFIVTPLFRNVESGLSKKQADELVRRWNHFEETGPSLEAIKQMFFGTDDD